MCRNEPRNRPHAREPRHLTPAQEKTNLISLMEAPRPTILIIDDEYDICITLQDLLTANGYEVHLAKTGHEGISIARGRRLDAVILDLGLPDQDGMAVLQTLNQLDPHLPIIVLTAFAKSERAVDSLSRGSFAYLRSPIIVMSSRPFWRARWVFGR